MKLGVLKQILDSIDDPNMEVVIYGGQSGVLYQDIDNITVEELFKGAELQDVIINLEQN